MADDLKKKNFFIPFIAMLFSAALGTVTGRLLGMLFFEEGGTLHLLLAEGIALHLNTQKFTFGSWFIECGFSIDFNLVGLLFVLIFLIIYKKL